MLREKVVFGPIRSRRLGSSLGINLLPQNGKLCNFDCIYCECGWNADGRDDRRIPTLDEVSEALKKALSDCKAKGTGIDSITFSGDGEPTLNPQFPQIVDAVLSLRDEYYPGAAVSVLSNATTCADAAIREALLKVDNAIMKIDAPDNDLAAVINRPHPGYDVRKVVEGLKKFNGAFVLQTMFLKAPGYDPADPSRIGRWMDIVRELRPRKVMVYTIDRPTPMEGLRAFSAAELQEIVSPLKEEGFDIQINA